MESKSKYEQREVERIIRASRIRNKQAAQGAARTVHRRARLLAGRCPVSAVDRIVAALRPAYPAVNPTLVVAVLRGTAMIATTGGGVSPELRAAILREREWQQ